MDVVCVSGCRPLGDGKVDLTELVGLQQLLKLSLTDGHPDKATMPSGQYHRELLSDGLVDCLLVICFLRSHVPVEHSLQLPMQRVQPGS